MCRLRSHSVSAWRQYDNALFHIFFYRRQILVVCLLFVCMFVLLCMYVCFTVYFPGKRARRVKLLTH